MAEVGLKREGVNPFVFLLNSNEYKFTDVFTYFNLLLSSYCLFIYLLLSSYCLFIYLLLSSYCLSIYPFWSIMKIFLTIFNVMKNGYPCCRVKLSRSCILLVAQAFWCITPGNHPQYL